MRWNSSSHSYGESYLHLQFTPKYRRWVFTNRLVMRVCRNYMSLIAKELGLKVEAMDFGPQHFHIFIGNWKNHSIAKLAQMFKGRSSYEMRKRLSKELKVFSRGKSFWRDGYFYETVGTVTKEARKFYIERCQNKHWQGIDYLDYQRMKFQQEVKLTDFLKPSGL